MFRSMSEWVLNMDSNRCVTTLIVDRAVGFCQDVGLPDKLLPLSRGCEEEADRE